MGIFDYFASKRLDLGYLTESQRAASEYIENESAIGRTTEEEVTYLRGQVSDLQEDMLRISDAFDGVGWAPLNAEESNHMSLKTVKKAATVGRAMYAMNPFVKRGVDARIAYIWGRSVAFDGVSAIYETLEMNRKKLFTAQSYEELERVLATDGNAFTALPVDSEKNADDSAKAFRIPLDQITGVVANPQDAEEIWLYKREYTVSITKSASGQTVEKNEVRYYPALGYHKMIEDHPTKRMRKTWNQIKVDQDFVIQHTTVNKQIGWRWGVPDVMAVVFWAKAYKEYLENNATLVEAYSRIAWSFEAPSAAGAQAAAAQVMRPPTRDPITGETRNIGGTAISPLGSHPTAMPATGSTVDFSKGDALAAAIAAGLGVSKVVILSDSGSSNRAAESSLDLPTLKAMESRQLLHSERFLELFEFWGVKVSKAPDAVPADAKLNDMKDISGAPKGKAKSSRIEEAKAPGGATQTDVAIVTWPQIESDSTKDRITAIGTGVELGLLYKQEARRETLETLGIAPYREWDDLPTMEDDPAAQEKFNQEKEAADAALAAAQVAKDESNNDPEFGAGKKSTNAALASKADKSVIAKQGVSGGITAQGGAQTSSNSARNNRSSDSKNK